MDLCGGRMGIACAKALGQEWAWSIQGWLEQSEQQVSGAGEVSKAGRGRSHRAL